MTLILIYGIGALALSIALRDRWWALLLSLTAGFAFGTVAAYVQLVDILGRR